MLILLVIGLYSFFVIWYILPSSALDVRNEPSFKIMYGHPPYSWTLLDELKSFGVMSILSELLRVVMTFLPFSFGLDSCQYTLDSLMDIYEIRMLDPAIDDEVNGDVHPPYA